MKWCKVLPKKKSKKLAKIDHLIHTIKILDQKLEKILFDRKKF